MASKPPSARANPAPAPPRPHMPPHPETPVWLLSAQKSPSVWLRSFCCSGLTGELAARASPQRQRRSSAADLARATRVTSASARLWSSLFKVVVSCSFLFFFFFLFNINSNDCGSKIISFSQIRRGSALILTAEDACLSPAPLISPIFHSYRRAPSHCPRTKGVLLSGVFSGWSQEHLPSPASRMGSTLK